MKRNLLVVTRNLPPLTGGMERLMFRALLELTGEHALCVVGPAGCREHLPGSIEARETPGSGVLGFLLLALPTAAWAALRFKPQVILAGSGVTAPVAWLLAKMLGVRYAVLTHGLDVIAPNQLYQRVFVPSIRAADLVIANSGNTRRLCEQAGVPARVLEVLQPGVEFPAKTPTVEFRAAFGIGDRPLLLSVGRIVPRKGLARFIRECLPAIVRAHPDVCLAIIGEEPAQALNRSESESRAIERAIRESGLHASVVTCGRVADDMLAAAYQASDLFVFPVLDLPGDVEGFGMVAIEAAAAGLATIGFRAGGLEDAVIDGRTGRLAEPEHYATLATMIISALDSERGSFRAACLAHAESHAWWRYGQRLAKHLQPLFPAAPDGGSAS